VPVIAFVNGKGGVGKSLAALNTGVALSKSASVVVVDADVSTGDLGGYLDTDGSLGSVLSGDRSLGEALLEGPAGLSVLPAGGGVEAVESAPVAAFPDLLGELRSEFDVVLVDTPPGLRDELPVCAGVSDWSLVVTTPTATALRDAERTIELVERAGGTVAGTVLTRATDDSDVETVHADLGPSVLGVVPEDPAVEDSTVVVAQSPECAAAAGFRTLADRVERCVAAEDPVGLCEDLDRPSVPTGSDDETASSPAEDLLDDSRPRAGTARDVDYHRDLIESARERTSNDS